MSISSEENETSNTISAASRRESAWAPAVTHLQVGEVPAGALGINLKDRQLTSPIQGFGPMWQRNYRVRLSGADVTPAQVVEDWKSNFANFQPPQNHFYPPLTGVKPGEIVFISTNLPIAPGLPGMIPLRSGVMVLYADDEQFAVMTPEGFPIAGINTFMAYEEDGVTVAHIQGLLRSSDPIYEFGFRFMGGEKQEDRIWYYVLERLAERWGVKGQVHFHKVLIDPQPQWKFAGNVFKNAAIRTFFYLLAAPVRWLLRPFRRNKTATTP
jgi:hypothetical protein